MYNIMPLLFLLLLFLLLLYYPVSSTRHICSNEGECEGKRLICSSRESCYIECSRNWSCRHTTIECPIGRECHIKCHYDGELDIATNGQYICQHMIIEATDSTLLIINASIGNQPNFPYPRTLENAEIHCPNNDNDEINGDKSCQIYCDGDDLMRGTTIMCMKGTNDLFIESRHYSKNWCIRNTELKCNTDYSVTCSLTNQPPFTCKDAINNQCKTMVDNQPTILPITTTSETTKPITTTTPPINNGETRVPTTRIPTPTPIVSNDGTRADAVEVDGGEAAIKNEGSPNAGLVAAVLIPVFILSILGLICAWWMMKKRDTWWTKEERRMKSQQTGQHQKIHSDAESDDDDDEDDNDNDDDDDDEINKYHRKKPKIKVNIDETKEEYDGYVTTKKRPKNSPASESLPSYATKIKADDYS